LFVGLLFVVGDVIERLVIVPWVRLFPDRREHILRRFVIRMRRLYFWLVRGMGGARFDIEPVIPCRAGELMVMNHQSLLDIPVLFEMVPDGYPRIVTRDRYGRGIPLVSHMLHLYDHRLVTHGLRSPRQFEAMAEFGRTSLHPVTIFPEGHRTRDGRLLKWKRGGLRALLGARRWRVHVIALDGLWQSLAIFEFVRNVSRVRCRVVEADTFDFDPDRDDVEAAIDRMRAAMERALAEMRSSDELEPEEERDYGAQPNAAE
jgi:1-acyl-sn-glycerol-3-phosphate acyltransferase